MNKTILTSALAILVSLTASSQVTVVAGERWNYFNCFFTMEHYNSLGDLMSSHTAELRQAKNILSMNVEEGDTLRLIINELRPDGNTVSEKNFVVEYNSEYDLVARTEKELNQVAVVLDRNVSKEQGWSWNWD